MTMTSHERHVISKPVIPLLVYRLFRPTSKKHQSPHYWPFVEVIHRWPVNFPYKGPVKRKNTSLWWHHNIWSTHRPFMCCCVQKKMVWILNCGLFDVNHYRKQDRVFVLSAWESFRSGPSRSLWCSADPSAAQLSSCLPNSKRLIKF